MPSPENTLRELRRDDLGPLGTILVDTGAFTAEEVDCALELLDIVLDEPAQTDYRVVVSAVDGEVAGYVLYGPIPLTAAAWDVYWIATSPGLQQQGHGRRLMARCEEDIAASGGGLVCIETSSQEGYAPTHRFYEALGYRVESRIRDFYKPGDDRLTYVRRLQGK